MSRRTARIEALEAQIPVEEPAIPDSDPQAQILHSLRFMTFEQLVASSREVPPVEAAP